MKRYDYNVDCRDFIESPLGEWVKHDEIPVYVVTEEVLRRALVHRNIKLVERIDDDGVLIAKLDGKND